MRVHMHMHMHIAYAHAHAHACTMHMHMHAHSACRAACECEIAGRSAPALLVAGSKLAGGAGSTSGAASFDPGTSNAAALLPAFSHTQAARHA